jgi:peptidoglycan lytic transglycosylase G
LNAETEIPEEKASAEESDAPAATTRFSIRKLAIYLAVGGAIALVLLLSIGAGLYAHGRAAFYEPGPTASDQVFELARGSGLNATAARLHDAGLISNPLVFRLALRVTGQSAALKAGEYAIPAGASMEQIAGILESGKSLLHKVTIAEGLTSWEAVQVIAANPVLVGEVPEVPAEGALLPETYLFTRGMTRAEIVSQMASAHDVMAARLWAERAENLPIDTLEEAVILASIVEKETGLASERPRVAAVFINRLRRGMRLQSDPTIIYGLMEGKGPLGRGIRRSELAQKTAYNTYQIDGLPPTPIANPGEASLAAVLNPPDTKDLFFVADGTGGHVFAETLREHERNVVKWRRIERSRRQ